MSEFADCSYYTVAGEPTESRHEFHACSKQDHPQLRTDKRCGFEKTPEALAADKAAADAFWCRCDPRSDEVEFHDDFACTRPIDAGDYATKHHYHCTHARCGKIVQVG